MAALARTSVMVWLKYGGIKSGHSKNNPSLGASIADPTVSKPVAVHWWRHLPFGSGSVASDAGSSAQLLAGAEDGSSEASAYQNHSDSGYRSEGICHGVAGDLWI